MWETEEVSAARLLLPVDALPAAEGDDRVDRGPVESACEETLMPEARMDTPSLTFVRDASLPVLPDLVDWMFVQQDLPLETEACEFDGYFGPLENQRHEKELRKAARIQNRLFARVERYGVGSLSRKEKHVLFNNPDFSARLRCFLAAKERCPNPFMDPAPTARDRSQNPAPDPAPAPAPTPRVPEPQQEEPKQEEAKKEEARPFPRRASPDPNLEEEAPETPEAPLESPVEQSRVRLSPQEPLVEDRLVRQGPLDPPLEESRDCRDPQELPVEESRVRRGPLLEAPAEDSRVRQGPLESPEAPLAPQAPLDPPVRRGTRTRISTAKAAHALFQRHQVQQALGIVVPDEEGPGTSKRRGGNKRPTKRPLQQMQQQQMQLVVPREEASSAVDASQPGPSRKRPAILKRPVLQQKQSVQRHEDQQQPQSKQRIYAADLERMRRNAQMSQFAPQRDAAPEEPQLQQKENRQPQLQLHNLFQPPKEQPAQQKPQQAIVVKPPTILRKAPRQNNNNIKSREEAAASEKEKIVAILHREAARDDEAAAAAQPPTRPHDASSSRPGWHPPTMSFVSDDEPKKPTTSTTRKNPEDPRKPVVPTPDPSSQARKNSQLPVQATRKYTAVQANRTLLRPAVPATAKVLLAPPPPRRAPLPPAAVRSNQVLLAAGSVRRVIVGPQASRGVVRVPVPQTRRVPPPPQRSQQLQEKQQQEQPPPVPVHRSSPFDCTVPLRESACTAKEAPLLDDDILAPEPHTPPPAATTGLPSMNEAFGSGFGSSDGHSYMDNTPPPENKQ